MGLSRAWSVVRESFFSRIVDYWLALALAPLVPLALSIWAALEGLPGYLVCVLAIGTFAFTCMAINEGIVLVEWAGDRWSRKRRFTSEAIALLDQARREICELEATPLETFNEVEPARRLKVWIVQARQLFSEFKMDHKWYLIESIDVPWESVPPGSRERAFEQNLLLAQWREHKRVLLEIIDETAGGLDT